MRKPIAILFLIVVYLIPNNVKAQEKEAAAIAAGALVAIGTGIAAVQQMEERAELTATEWILSNRPEMKSFSLKTLDFDGKKLKDLSSVSVITYEIQEFTRQDNPVLDGNKYVLLAFTSQGWINEYGIDFDKIKWFLVSSTEWINMMTAYVKAASDVKDEKFIREKLEKGKIVNKGIKIKSKLVIPFFKLNGDMYVTNDYSDEMKFVYNERSLGIFLKETEDLVQISRKSIISIHEFFFYENN
ncbi:hypothetical protein [Marinifilum flexuosum]|uniref:hypothetical protein n=1 Tax=Marinifilum flexuosum TaxID=1117708 RepID=UPI00249577A8|nr:hypothetical protein [Marinifilum flexuosum]